MNPELETEVIEITDVQLLAMGRSGQRRILSSEYLGHGKYRVRLEPNQAIAVSLITDDAAARLADEIRTNGRRIPVKWQADEWNVDIRSAASREQGAPL